jgi:hypothetical protein
MVLWLLAWVNSHPTSRQEAEESRSLILYVGNFAAGTPLKTTMPILMDQVLTEYADQAYETARLGRTGVQTTRDRLLAEILADLEASGEAMRYVTSRGRIAWKATPQLPDYLTDLQLDAEADLEDI